MKKSIFFLLCLFISYESAQAWGFWAHQRINRMAVFTLPPEMIALYKKNLEYITEHAVDPDKRRGAIEGEDACHYIDLDHYGKYPVSELPRFWEDAVKKYTEDSLKSYGIVPYHIPVMMQRLTNAFKNKDLDRIMKVSADLGHYIADAHVPLHTTENYNGQMTGQKGIHGFWESRLPELYAEKYNFYVGKAVYVEDILMEPWAAVLESHVAVDSVLTIERKLTEAFPSDKKFGFESRNGVLIRVYSREFSEAYHKALAGMVQRRMRMAITRVGCLWYTAWKNAGSPDLKSMIERTPQEIKESYERKAQIIDRELTDVGYRRCRPGSKYDNKYPMEEMYSCCSHKGCKKG